MFKRYHQDATMQSTSAPSAGASSGFDLFATVPDDLLQLGLGDALDARRVTTLLLLKKDDVAKIAAVSAASVRYDEAMPQAVHDRLEEIASIMNMVATAFHGDEAKTVAWFKAKNPMLGDVAPRDMIRLGRYERLRRFVVGALISRRDSSAPAAPLVA